MLTASSSGNVNFAAGNGGGTMRIRNSTIGGNTAGTYGGGIANSGRLELQGVTIANNFANFITAHTESGDITFPANCDPGPCAGIGGGIENEGMGTVQLVDTVVAENAGFGPWPDCLGVLITGGHNAIGNTAGCTWERHGVRHDELNVDPKLGNLEDDGVAGNAHYPVLAGSPLIDAGTDTGDACTPRDQIGEPRSNGGPEHGHRTVCDIGAIEYQRPRGH